MIRKTIIIIAITLAVAVLVMGAATYRSPLAWVVIVAPDLRVVSTTYGGRTDFGLLRDRAPRPRDKRIGELRLPNARSHRAVRAEWDDYLETFRTLSTFTKYPPGPLKRFEFGRTRPCARPNLLRQRFAAVVPGTIEVERMQCNGEAYKTGAFVAHKCTRVSIALWLPLVVVATYPTVAFIRGPLRRYRRAKQGLCVRCGYNLTGNVSGTCSECGEAITGGDAT